MSTIIVAAVLILVIISICLILVSLNNKDRQKTTTELLNHFSKLGTENNLSFSSQEILQNCIIGLDGIQRKLLILKKNDEDKYDSLILDLNDVKSCSKKKIYRSVNVGTEKRKSLRTRLIKSYWLLILLIIGNRFKYRFLILLRITYLRCRNWNKKRRIGKLFLRNY